MRKKSLNFLIIFVILLSFYCSNKCIAQNDNFLWLDFGVGGSGFGLSGGLIPSYQIGNNLYSFRYIGSVEFRMEGPTPDEHINDFGILYGKIYRDKGLLCSASIGVGVVNGIRRGEFIESGYEYRRHEQINFTNIGIPIDIQFFVGGNYIGIGWHLFGNLNFERNYGGIIMCFQIGKRANY